MNELSIAALIMVVLANLLWYRAKLFLRSHGYAVSWFWHLRDIPNLIRMSKSADSSDDRRRAKAVLLQLVFGVAIFLGAILLLASAGLFRSPP